MKDYDFIKNVESLVDPIKVGSIHFFQQFLGKLPINIQNRIIEGASNKTPHMGFVVEPYSSFLCYEVKDVEKANSILSDNFEMIKSSVIKGEEPKYYALFGSFNVHTSAFWGQRMEFYLVAKDKTTGLLSWIIVDYDTNTISHDKKGGLTAPTTRKSVMTTDYDGNVIVDVVRADESHEIRYDFNVRDGEVMEMDDNLWLFGNLSIGYARDISNNSPEVFSLKFNPKEVATAIKIDDGKFNIEKNTWYSDLIKNKPEHVLVFPFAQHMVSDSPGNASLYQNIETMLKDKESLEFEGVEVYDPASTTKLMMLSTTLLMLIIVILIILLIIKW